MKTNKQNTNRGLKNRSEQLGTDSSKQSASAQNGHFDTSTEKKDNRLPIDHTARRRNRQLNTDGLLNMLTGAMPEVYRLAEVVGKWVWVQFSETPPAEIRQKLAQLGFHWNRERQAWQHPCGTFRDSASSQDPRERYGSFFPAQSHTA